MVDSQVLERWLEDVALFQAEPVDYQLNFDDLLDLPKTNNEVNQVMPGLSDLGWLDEKVDLSVFDNPNNLLYHPNEAESLMVEDAANLLLGLVDNSSSFDTSDLSSHDFKIDENDFLQDIIVPEFKNSIVSSEVHKSHLASPGVNSLQVHSPFFSSLPSPANTSIFSDASQELSSPQLSPASFVPVNSPIVDWDSQELSSPQLSPAPVVPVKSPMVDSDLSENFSISSPAVTVTVCDNASQYAEAASVSSPGIIVAVCNDASQYHLDAETASLEEISKSFKKKKCINNGKEVPKIRIVMKNPSHPYSVASSRIKDRRERKKVQNKEAAARYRIKRRIEDDLLSDEVMSLEDEQKKLKEKHDGLQAEIKYLKSLMREILEKKGVLKSE